MSQVQHAAKNKQNLLVLINRITLTAYYDDMLKLNTNSTEVTVKFRSKLGLYLMIATVVKGKSVFSCLCGKGTRGFIRYSFKS